MKLSVSTKIYGGPILLLAILNAASVYLPPFEGLTAPTELPAPRPVLALANGGIALVLYGGLGLLGLILSRRLGFADVWNQTITNKDRFLTPARIGGGLGVFIIIADIVFSRWHAYGPLPHPPFPASVMASLSAGIGEEVLFRLFLVSFWTWLISSVIFRGKYLSQSFWFSAILSALAFGAGHLPALMTLSGFQSVAEIPPGLLAEIFFLNGVVSVFAANYFRKYGFLAAAGIHFWADIVWHVVWGGLTG